MDLEDCKKKDIEFKSKIYNS